MRLISVFAAIGGALLATAATAATTFYTNPASFAAATSGLVTYNFQGIAPPNYFALAPSFTVGGVTFDNYGNDFIIPASLFGVYGGVDFYSGQVRPNTTITLPGVTAFSLNYGSYSNANPGTPISFTLNDGSVFSTNLPGVEATLTFLGFTSTTPITSILVYNDVAVPSPVFDVVNFQVGQLGNAVPEPASWAMLIMGFGLTGAVLRKQRRAIA